MQESLNLTEDRPAQGPWILTASGEIDLYTAPDLREALDRAIEARRDVILDLEGTEFIDSTGLGVLVDGHRRLQEAESRLVLVNPQPAITRTLEITVLDRVLEMTNSVDEARSSLGDGHSAA